MNRLLCLALLPLIGLGGCHRPEMQIKASVISDEFEYFDVNQPQTTKNIKRIAIGFGRKTRWVGLVAPTTRGEEVSFTLKNAASVGEVVNGWAYLTGQWPAGSTKRISAVGSGTRMIIQEENNHHRVFFLGDLFDSIEVELLDGDRSTRTMTTRRTYLELTPEASTLPTAPFPKIKGSEFEEFVEMVESLANATDTK